MRFAGTLILTEQQECNLNPEAGRALPLCQDVDTLQICVWRAADVTGASVGDVRPSPHTGLKMDYDPVISAPRCVDQEDYLMQQMTLV